MGGDMPRTMEDAHVAHNEVLLISKTVSHLRALDRCCGSSAASSTTSYGSRAFSESTTTSFLTSMVGEGEDMVRSHFHSARCHLL